MKSKRDFQRMMRQRDEAWCQENPEALEALWEQYNELGQNLREDEPHPWDYREGDSDPGYRRSFEDWREQRAEEKIAHAMGKALYARDQAIKPPPVVDWDFAVATRSGDPEDRRRALDNLNTRDTVQRLRADAARAKEVGNLARSRELSEMADYQERLKDSRDRGKYKFQEQQDEALLDGVGKQLKEVEGKWLESSPQALEEARSWCRSWNHESPEQFSYAVKENGDRFTVVSLEHSGQMASRLARITGGDQEISALMDLKFPPQKEGEAQAAEPEPGPERNPRDPEQMTQKEFEAWRVENGAPNT